MNRDTLTRAVAAIVLFGLVAVPLVAWTTGTPPPFASAAHARQAARGDMPGMGRMPGMGGTMAHMAMVESEFDYLAQMIPHHQEAIDSAQMLLDGTERPEMRAFAERIIETQSAEVAQMEEWLATWYPGQEPTVDYEPMMRDLTGLTGDELDQAFLEDMVGHHMGAVMMSQQLVAQGLTEHAQVVPFAEQIRDTQHAEIFQMSGWLADWFGASPMRPMGVGH